VQIRRVKGTPSLLYSNKMTDSIKIYKTWYNYENPFKIVVNETKKTVDVFNREFISRFKNTLVSRLNNSYQELFVDEVSVLLYIGLENNCPTYILISNIIAKFSIPEDDMIVELYYSHDKYRFPCARGKNNTKYCLNNSYLSDPAAYSFIKQYTHAIHSIQFLCVSGEYYSHEPKLHYCGEEDCEGDCGILVCGCIDRCRCSCHTHDIDRY
jgi:hypothetical protein